MPKPRKYESVRCLRFTWRLVSRGGKWYADGRSNTPSAGRHSLGTADKQEALRLLPELDRVRAEDLGLILRSIVPKDQACPLTLEDGRKLYERHIARPRVTGGVRRSTQKRYRTVFDKFLKFAASRGVTVWNVVTANLLVDYAGHLQREGYAHKTLINELTTLKQAVKWMIEQEHLNGMEPIKLRLRKAESEPAYCYRGVEIQAMVRHCRASEALRWLADVITALACTGLRIAELASLRCVDIDFATGRLKLTDETGRASNATGQRRNLKSGRSRSFPIHPDLLVVLKRKPRDGAYLFHGPRGGHLMDGLGHANSEMIRHYYHLHDDEAKARTNQLDFLGGAGGRSACDKGEKASWQFNTYDGEVVRSGGQGIRTLNPLRGTHFPSGLLAIRIPSFFGLRHFES